MLSPSAAKVFEKYLIRDAEGNIAETIEDSFRRVAWGIAQEDEQPQLFYEKLLAAMMGLELVPNRPAWFGIGRPTGFTSACTVIDIQDDLGREEGSIMDSLHSISMIQQQGGGVGQNWSRLRPRGAIISRTGGKSTGPVGFLKAFNAVLKTIQQGGMLQGANNAAMIISHPDILEFIRLKLDEYSLDQYNTNVMLTDEFMRAVEHDGWFDLVHGGRVYKTVKAKEIFYELIDAIWTNGGIGVQFWDAFQRGNTVLGLGPLVSTNPCGEIIGFPYECCNLGYINLSKMVSGGGVDWNNLERLARLGIRMIDNLIEANKYIPEVPGLERQAKLTRRIGLSITGLADMLIGLGSVYGSAESLELAGQVMEFIMYHAMAESVNLAKERGSFPAIDKSIFAKDNFSFKAPIPLYKFTKGLNRPFLDWDKLIGMIQVYGIRNCGVTAIAPGSFGSETMETEGYGLEPIFSASYKRNRKDCDDEWWSQERHSELQDSPAFISAMEVSPEQHLLMQAALQRFVTEGISKTVNLPEDTPRAEIWRLIMLAWKLGIKGLTFYRANSRQVEVMECAQCQVVI
jgi:ribonucleoside-diphosphate reductase alpha chain